MKEVRLSLFMDKTVQPSKPIKKLQQTREFCKAAGCKINI